MAKFQKGRSGNPSGRPKGLTEVTGLCRKFDEKAIARLGWLMENGEPHATQLRAAEALLDRGWGRPAQAVVHKGVSEEDLAFREILRLTNGDYRKLPSGEDTEDEG